MEDSARTLKDYENLIAWYDRLDANRQHRERYHELFHSCISQADYGSVVINAEKESAADTVADSGGVVSVFLAGRSDIAGKAVNVKLPFVG